MTSISNFGRTVYVRLRPRRHAHFFLYLMSSVVQWNVESIVQMILYNTKVMPIRAQLSLQRRATAKPFLRELNVQHTITAEEPGKYREAVVLLVSNNCFFVLTSGSKETNYSWISMSKKSFQTPLWGLSSFLTKSPNILVVILHASAITLPWLPH